MSDQELINDLENFELMDEPEPEPTPVVQRAPTAVDAVPNPAQMLMQLVQQNASLEKLEKFMDLQERWEADQARKAFAAAMVKAQQGAKAVAANAYNEQTKSDYATLAAVVDVVTPMFTGAGISLSFYEGVTDKADHVRVMCDIMHESGHAVTRHIDMPIVTTGFKGSAMMTLTHATGSAFSYGRRYLTLMISNLATGDDDDGQAAGLDWEAPAVITETQAATLKKLLERTNSDVKMFLKACGGYASVDELPAAKYSAALLRLNEKLEKQNAER